MDINVNGHSLYAYTGGKPFNPAQPTVVFIHGVLNDHSVWILQSRHFAHHGWNVLAIDLPGQGRSRGAPPASVEKAADSVLALLDAVGAPQAALVGGLHLGKQGRIAQPLAGHQNPGAAARCVFQQVAQQLA